MTFPPHERDIHEDVLGQPGVDGINIAKETGAVLWTEENQVARLASENLGCRRIRDSIAPRLCRQAPYLGSCRCSQSAERFAHRP
jgi:hypothetical protein